MFLRPVDGAHRLLVPEYEGNAKKMPRIVWERLRSYSAFTKTRDSVSVSGAAGMSVVRDDLVLAGAGNGAAGARRMGLT
jgi:hypothetical protein